MYLWQFAGTLDDAKMTNALGYFPRTATPGLTKTTKTSASSSYGAVSTTLDVKPILGRYLHVKAYMGASAGTATLKVDIVRTGAPDTLVEFTTTAASALNEGTYDLSALANSGDCRGGNCIINIYLKCSGGGTASMYGLTVMTGESSSDNDYLKVF